MKRLITLIGILTSVFKLSAASLPADSGKIQPRVTNIDSLKQILKTTTNDTLRVPVYTQIAAYYSNFDTLSNAAKRQAYQSTSLSYTLKALHIYSLFNDTLGLRISFDNLAKVYNAQHKYSEAKWFILQSNSLSRAKKDTLNIICSLITLADIKGNIKDYALATRDLNDALALSTKIKDLPAQSLVLRNFGFLYSKQKNYKKEALMLKKRDSVEAVIQKNAMASVMEKIAAKDALERQRLDTLMAKKKLFMTNLMLNYSIGSSTKATL